MEAATTDTISLTPEQESFRSKMVNSWLFRTFLFFRVPAGWIAGMKLVELSAQRAVSTVPFKWLNKNPFKSMYFAVQSMAAELSTASLVLLAMQGKKPSIAYIIIDMSGEFPKKATSRVHFTCEGGEEVFDAVERCIATGEPAVVKLKTVGTMADGTVVSTFYFTWSMKQRRK